MTLPMDKLPEMCEQMWKRMRRRGVRVPLEDFINQVHIEAQTSAEKNLYDPSRGKPEQYLWGIVANTGRRLSKNERPLFRSPEFAPGRNDLLQGAPLEQAELVEFVRELFDRLLPVGKEVVMSGGEGEVDIRAVRRGWVNSSRARAGIRKLLWPMVFGEEYSERAYKRNRRRWRDRLRRARRAGNDPCSRKARRSESPQRWGRDDCGIELADDE